MPPPPPSWFVMIDGQENGPMTVSNLSQRFASGDIDAGSFVWKDGMDEWVPAAQVDELASVFAPKAPAKRPPPPPAAAKAKSKPKPPQQALVDPRVDSHAFKGRDDDSEEIVLELDLPQPPKPGSIRGAPVPKPSSIGITPAKGTNTPAKAIAAPVTTSAPAAPSGPKFGGAAKPPSQPYGVPVGGAATPGGRGLPKAPAPEEDDDIDWADRTSVEPLPFGERVHQEKVAGSLFDSTDPNAVAPGLGPTGKTGSYALDMSNWASAEMKNKPPSVEKPAEAAAAKAIEAPRANPVLRPASSAALSPPKPTTALRQPLPPEPSNMKMIVALVAGGAVIACALVVFMHFAMK